MKYRGRYTTKSAASISKSDWVYSPDFKRYLRPTRVEVPPEGDYYGRTVEIRWGLHSIEVPANKDVSVYIPDQPPSA